jgi:uncharacterized protein with von Willebrand factor type A (vWA) domain
MQQMLATLVDELRNVGIGVSVGEHLDAAHAISRLSLHDKEIVRAALQCALIKRPEHIDAFNLLFDLYTAGTQAPGAELAAELTDQQLRDMLRAVIGSQDSQTRRLLADEYVRRFGGLQPGSAVAGVFATIAVNEAANLDGIRAELLADAADRAVTCGACWTRRPPTGPSPASAPTCRLPSGARWSPTGAPAPCGPRCG